MRQREIVNSAFQILPAWEANLHQSQCPPCQNSDFRQHRQLSAKATCQLKQLSAVCPQRDLRLSRPLTSRRLTMMEMMEQRHWGSCARQLWVLLNALSELWCSCKAFCHAIL